MFSCAAVTLIILECVVASNMSALRDRRIYKGYAAGIHNYAHAVFLQFEKSNPKSCGGSLIMAQAVLTAAHCMDELEYNDGKIRAYFGSTIPLYSKMVIDVVDYEISPKYDEDTGACNLAVVLLAKPATLQHTTKKIPLVTNVPEVGSTLWTAGWGYQIVGPRYKAALSLYRPLHCTKQELLDNREASEFTGAKNFQSSLFTYYIRGEHAKDDAGNGLVVKEPRLLLVGVFSHVIDGVSVYTNVVTHRDWIGIALNKLYQSNNCTQGKNQ